MRCERPHSSRGLLYSTGFVIKRYINLVETCLAWCIVGIVGIDNNVKHSSNFY